MNKTEKMAKQWLLKQGIAEKDLFYQHSRSPDFIDLKRQHGYEAKRLYTKSIILWKRQYEIMKGLNFPTTILVFSGKQAEPDAKIPLDEIDPETTIWHGVLIRWQPSPKAQKQEKTSLSAEDLEALENICTQTGQSKSALIRQAVKYWLDHGPYAGVKKR